MFCNIILVNVRMVETFLKLLKVSYMEYDSHFSVLPWGVVNIQSEY